MRQTGLGTWLAGAAVAALLSLGVNAHGDPAGRRGTPPLTRLLEGERNTIEVFRRVSPSVVFITSAAQRRPLFRLESQEFQLGTGSGVVWDREGHVVTNFHLVAGGDSFSVTLVDGGVHEARLVGSEPAKDLAVLEIEVPEKGLAPIPLGSSLDLVVGQKVLALGNPFGLDQTLTTGVISALGRQIPSQVGTTIRDMIQTDASINPGNSGGPLLDSSGRLIGINTAIVSPSGSSAGVGFAVPVDTVKRIVPELVRHGFVRRPGLGVTVLSDEVAQRFGVVGVIVHEVEPGSPAAGAGLRPLRTSMFGNVVSFDLLVALDGVPLLGYDDLFSVLEEHEPGDEVGLQYVRGDDEFAVRLLLQ